MPTMMNIGEAAAAAGVTPKMVRHYEALGLIPEADRTEAGYRLYGEREVAMLRFIRQCRGLGFSMQQVDALLALWRDPGRQSREVREVALRQLAELEERRRELEQMRGTLEQLVAACRGDADAHCPILERLGADAPAAAAPIGPIRTLKEVRPGTRRAPRPRTVTRPQAPAPAHAALSAWMGALARGA